jgi:hypothetical protein
MPTYHSIPELAEQLVGDGIFLHNIYIYSYNANPNQTFSFLALTLTLPSPTKPTLMREEKGILATRVSL